MQVAECRLALPCPALQWHQCDSECIFVTLEIHLTTLFSEIFCLGDFFYGTGRDGTGRTDGRTATDRCQKVSPLQFGTFLKTPIAQLIDKHGNDYMYDQLKNQIYLIRLSYTKALLFERIWHEIAIFPALHKLTHTYLTLSRVAPLAVSKGWGGWLGPPLVSKGVGGLWVQILVATSYLTMIDTRQKDLSLSDA